MKAGYIEAMFAFIVLSTSLGFLILQVSGFNVLERVKKFNKFIV